MIIETSVVNAMMAAIEATIGTSAKFQVWAGAVPAHITDAPAGTMIVEMDLPSDYLTAPDEGVIVKNGNWTGTAEASAVATFGRLCTSAGSARIQFTISYAAVAWSTEDDVALNERRKANGGVYVCSQAGTTAAVGDGPTGTGTGIADGTAEWDWVSAVGEATLDNTNIAETQVVTVTSISFTGPNLDA